MSPPILSCLDNESSMFQNYLQEGDRISRANNTFVHDKVGLESLISKETDFLIANLECLDEGQTPIDDMLRYLRIDLAYNGLIIALEPDKDAYERIESYLFHNYNTPIIVCDMILKIIGGEKPDLSSTVMINYNRVKEILAEIENQMYRLTKFKQPNPSTIFQPEFSTLINRP